MAYNEVNSYISMDLKTQCYITEYYVWIGTLILPFIFFFCVMMPFIAIIFILNSKRRHFENPKEMWKKAGFLLQSFGLDNFYWF